MNPYRSLLLLMTFSTLLWLVGCGSDDGKKVVSDPTPASFGVTVTNISASQPLSPVAVVLHGAEYSAWELGASASNALEVLAESGASTDLIQAADADPDVLATAAGSGVVMPGASDSVNLTVTTADPIFLTMATMLVNTNDAFGGLNARSLDDLEVGQSATFMVPAYDAGTEANSESAATVPGPAAGGEGYNAARDDTDVVHVHPGVISNQDGLAGSALNGNHRWDNPVLKLVVTRTS